jgi:NTP pyrophosphatase (non-canonical NTP hydrolase)
MTFEEPVVEGLTPHDQIVSAVRNAIGWAVFSGDGRPVVQDGEVVVEPWEEGEAEKTISLTDEETKLAEKAALKAMGVIEILRHPFEDLRRLQAEQAAWSQRNFGDPKDPIGHVAAMGLSEEAGELADAVIGGLAEVVLLSKIVGAIGRLNHAQLKGEQAIRHTPEEIKAKKADAVGDLLIYLSDFCTMADLDMGDCAHVTWSQVIERDWAASPMTGKATADDPLVTDPDEAINRAVIQEVTDPALIEPGTKVRAVNPGYYKDSSNGPGAPVEYDYEFKEGDYGEITAITDDGIFVVWDDDGTGVPRPVLYGDLAPVTPPRDDEDTRPNVTHADVEGVLHDQPAEVGEVIRALNEQKDD